MNGGEKGEEAFNFFGPEFAWMLTKKGQELFDPLEVRLFCSETIMLQPNGPTNLVEEGPTILGGDCRLMN